MQHSQKGQLREVFALLTLGADPNIRNQEGGTALLLACSGGHDHVTAVLLAAGASPNVRNWKTLDTPLHKALSIKNWVVAWELLRKGAIVELLHGTETALMRVIQAKIDELALEMVRRSRRLGLEKSQSKSAVELAVQNASHGVLSAILARDSTLVSAAREAANQITGEEALRLRRILTRCEISLVGAVSKNRKAVIDLKQVATTGKLPEGHLDWSRMA